MSDIKHPILKLLSFAAVLAMMLPRLVVAEFGICPPYEKRFGPDDPAQEIEAFVMEINLRPGGGTLLLAPGDYDFAAAPVTGTVCMQRDPASEDADDFPGNVGDLRIEPGGKLTLRSVPADSVSVEPGATFFAEDADIELALDNRGSAYVRHSSAQKTRNYGTLVWRGGRPGHFGFRLEEGPSLINQGWALVDQVEIPSEMFCAPKSCSPFDSYRNPAIENSGVLTVLRSTVIAGCDITNEPDKYGPGECNEEDLIVSQPGATLYITSSTVLGRTSILNLGGTVEIGQSVVAGNCENVPITDTGYNVFAESSCSIAQASSIWVDPELLPKPPRAGWTDELSAELGPGSPAIDLIPLDLCKATDMLGRARNDGNSDGIVACDAGALEFSGRVVTVRTAYWKDEVGLLDLRERTALIVGVLSTADFDATTIDFATIDIVGLESDALRGPVFVDKDRDGTTDYVFRYKLNRMPPLDCGSYDQAFSARTNYGLELSGRLRFDVVGCTP